jgi:uncharacterized repeat protein (TIGR03837 family)
VNNPDDVERLLSEENGRNLVPSELTTLPSRLRRWDIFCRVVDNFGDIGVCWRMARQLALEYQADVRLWVDNLASLACLVPSISLTANCQNVGGVQIRHWTTTIPLVEPADVVIEAFACEIPESYRSAIANREPRPAWINLEYLSAEAWVDDCHGLSSPNPQFPHLKKHFFFPGFTPRTGGLLCEQNLLRERALFSEAEQATVWKTLGIPAKLDEELRFSLFCYDNPQVSRLLTCWDQGPTPISVLVTPGLATRQVSDWFGRELKPGTSLKKNFLTAYGLPFVSQPEYDRLLWSCDFNFVRGEDSFVRAQWAQRPFVWQIYPQEENTHLVKLEAFLNRYRTGMSATAAGAICRFWRCWNGTTDIRLAWKRFAEVGAEVTLHSKDWVRQLDRIGNLADNLVRFVLGL